MTRRAALVGGLALVTAACGLHQSPVVERKATSPGTMPSANAADANAAVGGNSPAAAAFTAPGIVEPTDGATELAAAEGGRLAVLSVREGAVVTRGQLLATLDDATQRNELALAEADVGAAEAANARVVSGATDGERREAIADSTAAAAKLRFALATARRHTALWTDSVTTASEMERATSEAGTAAADLDRVAARLATVRIGARPEVRAESVARLAMARARRDIARAALARRRVTAPKDGTILLSRFHAGEYYEPNSGPLFVLGDLRALQVRLEVDEADAPDVTKGAQCVLKLDDGVVVGSGVITRIAPRMGRRGLPSEVPTARADLRVREVFVAVKAGTRLVPGQRVWGEAPRAPRRNK